MDSGDNLNKQRRLFVKAFLRYFSITPHVADQILTEENLEQYVKLFDTKEIDPTSQIDMWSTMVYSSVDMALLQYIHKIYYPKTLMYDKVGTLLNSLKFHYQQKKYLASLGQKLGIRALIRNDVYNVESIQKVVEAILGFTEYLVSYRRYSEHNSIYILNSGITYIASIIYHLLSTIPVEINDNLLRNISTEVHNLSKNGRGVYTLKNTLTGVVCDRRSPDEPALSLVKSVSTLTHRNRDHVHTATVVSPNRSDAIDSSNEIVLSESNIERPSLLPAKKYSNEVRDSEKIDSRISYLISLVERYYTRVDPLLPIERVVSILRHPKNRESINSCFKTRRYDPSSNLEIFEFFGDSVMNKAMMWYVLEKFITPLSRVDKQSGIITKAKTHYQSVQFLNRIVDVIGLHAYVSSTPEDSSEKMHTDSFEAIIGCLFKLVNDDESTNTTVPAMLGYTLIYNMISGMMESVHTVTLKYEVIVPLVSRYNELITIPKNGPPIVDVSQFKHLPDHVKMQKVKEEAVRLGKFVPEMFLPFE